MAPHTFSLLARLLDYELRCAKRYRRFISLVLMRSSKIPDLLSGLPANTFRDSDELLEMDNGALIIMTETAPEAAEQAVERIKQLLERTNHIEFDLVCFPRDGHTTEALLQACSKVNAAPEPIPVEAGGAVTDEFDHGRGAGIRYVDSHEGYF